MTTQIAAKQKSSRFRFFGEILAELRKVVWLSRREARYLTGLVLLVAIVAGIVLGVIDYGFTRLIDAIIGVR